MQLKFELHFVISDFGGINEWSQLLIKFTMFFKGIMTKRSGGFKRKIADSASRYINYASSFRRVSFLPLNIELQKRVFKSSVQRGFELRNPWFASFEFTNLNSAFANSYV